MHPTRQWCRPLRRRILSQYPGKPVVTRVVHGASVAVIAWLSIDTADGRRINGPIVRRITGIERWKRNLVWVQRIRGRKFR